jgi:glutathione synthase/RimK-type ligase-like ATP-grasp enzyme
MLLIVTNKSDLASDYLILRLQERGIPFARFNTEDYPELVSIDVIFKGNCHEFSIRFPNGFQITQGDLSSVYFRQPVPPSFPGIEDSVIRRFVEDEFAELLRSLWRLIPESIWLNHPRKLWWASNKVEQLVEAADIGFSVPDTLISHSRDSLKDLLVKKKGHIVAKAVRHGFVRNNEKVFLAGTQRLPEDFLEKFNCYINVATTYQEEVRKAIDIRVVVVGNDVFPTKILIDREKSVDWRVADIEGYDLMHEPIELPLKTRENCIEIVRRFGLKYSSIDLMQDVQGTFYFLELNPNGQWAWIEQLTGYKIRDSIIDSLVANIQK